MLYVQKRSGSGIQRTTGIRRAAIPGPAVTRGQRGRPSVRERNRERETGSWIAL